MHYKQIFHESEHGSRPVGYFKKVTEGFISGLHCKTTPVSGQSRREPRTFVFDSVP